MQAYVNEYENYLSPFTWRYATPEMRRLWSERYKRVIWRRIWVALAEVQAEFGVVSPEQAADLRANADAVDVQQALQIEAEIHHDLMAELQVFAQQSPVGGAILHLGATSADIEDNADALRMRQSLDLLLEALRSLLSLFAEKVEEWSGAPVIAFTHLQPAEPSTLGYRLALYAQDLLDDWEALTHMRAQMRGKGFKGAVGTGASYGELIGTENLAEFERRLSERLELVFYPVASQTSPRKQDYRVLSALAGLGASLYKFAFDLRLLQSPVIGELAEPFGSRQIGSSAMPFKRNPINAEKIDSLGRALAQMPRVAWDNASHSLLERTLDDSANRRTLLPEAFLIADELLRVAADVLAGLQVDEAAMAHNLFQYGSFAASERILMALGKAGGDRQKMHGRLRELSLAAWVAVRDGQPNPLVESICQDQIFRAYLTEDELRARLDASQYLGDAPARARALAASIRNSIGQSK